jgi:hypothetical protein
VGAIMLVRDLRYLVADPRTFGGRRSMLSHGERHPWSNDMNP